MTEIPESLARFQIVRVLGKGGMGTVYLARDQRLGRQVALKVLNPDEFGAGDRHHRFVRESRAAAAIRHPNVATIYEVEDADDRHYIVMEYCEGETLAQRLRRRPVDAAEFLSIARQIVAGVAAAHENGVVHRDIKAANIIIESSGVVKILDFGLAKVRPGADEKTSIDSTSGHFFGTLHYLSPEQARGQSADERSDLFSIGVVLYQMASGHLPFNADSPLLVLEKIRDAEPEPFVPLDPAFPLAASQVIARLLQKQSADRYANARELANDLDAIDMPTLRTTSKTLLGRTRPRRKIAVRGALIVAAIALIGTAVYFGQRNVPSPSVEASTAALAPLRSMAVLPLNNLASNGKDDFLSVGLADALVTKLQQVPSLQVRPTSAVLEFRNEKNDVKSVSRKLQVDGILDGHFLAAGDFVRVNLQLTDARTGYNVWADTVDGKRSDLLHLIDAVTDRTVSGLNERLGFQQVIGRASQPRSTNAKAFEQYLRARAVSSSLVAKDYEAGISSLKKAIELDPNFAAAYADLAIALSIGQTRGLTSDPNTIEKAEAYAREAVRLDPNLAAAHVAMARSFVRFNEHFAESVRENLAALRLNPNETQSLWGMATYFVSIGDLPRLQCVGHRLVQLDPFSNEAKTRGYWFVNTVDGEEALDSAKYALASRDTELAGHDIRANAYLLLGNLAAAEQEAQAATTLAPNHYLGKSLKAMIAAARDDRTTAEHWLGAFERDAEHNHWAAIRVGLVRARLGDRDPAIRWLQRSAELGHHNWYAMVKHPWLQGLQNDPQFQKIISKMKADLDAVADDVAGVYHQICR
jgi:serine/threonine protein kinase/tetratricopeptide (TPR) repeat protein